MDNLRNKLKKINTIGLISFDEPMYRHTTFETGGPADIFIAPETAIELKTILELLKSEGLGIEEVFILGGGANLLVSDEGIRGIVIDTSRINSIKTDPEAEVLTAGAGASVDQVAEAALDAGLSGFDSFYGMPGTIGGSIWMNARCYGRSFSDILESVVFFDKTGKITESSAEDLSFDYKKSPFQKMPCIITEASFRLSKGNKKEIESNMKMNREDRKNKGHYAAPCAGSVFKNNRVFGKPSGAIIDSLGFRGYSIGQAAVSECHANIFINKGGATSLDIFRLIKHVSDKVFNEYGFRLEPEVQFIGQFPGQ